MSLSEYLQTLRKAERPRPLCRVVGSANFGHWHPSMVFRDILGYTWPYGQSPILFVGIVSCPFARVTRRPDTLFSCSLAVTCAPPAVTCVSISPGARVVLVHLALERVPTLDVWRRGSTTGFLFSPTTQMDRFFKNKNKRKKSPEPLQPRVPTNIVDRPPGFRAELGIALEGGRSLSCRDLGVD
jgi:hypothetical protein